MNYSIHRISLDIHDTNSQVFIRVNRGDTNRKIVATLADGGRPYQITGDCTAVFSAKKPDGNHLYNICSIKGGCISYKFNEQTAPVVGQMECELKLYSTVGSLLTSPRFTIIVDDTVFYDGEVVSSPQSSVDKFKAMVNTTISVASEEELDGVTEIGDYAFYSRKKLCVVDLPDILKKIGQYAFNGCESLTEIEIPDSVNDIGKGAFYRCYGLSSVRLPANLKTIENEVFRECESLQKIEIPSTVESIGAYGVYIGSSSKKATVIMQSETPPKIQVNSLSPYIEKIVVPFGLQETYKAATNWSEYADRIVPGDTVEVIREQDLDGVVVLAADFCRGFEKLEEVYIPNGVTEIGDYAFRDCPNLRICTLPQSVSAIGKGAFYNCYSLEEIIIPSGVTSIRGSTFYQCDSLSCVEIPDTVTNISGTAFYGCDGLTELTIPDSVETIGNDALRIGSISNKATITMLGKTPPSIIENTFKAEWLDKIIVPAGSRNAYKNATNWSKFADYIVEGVIA